ncbi:MAG: hypothetical protein WBQ53_04530, partial [Methylocystis sp.]
MLIFAHQPSAKPGAVQPSRGPSPQSPMRPSYAGGSLLRAQIRAQKNNVSQTFTELFGSARVSVLVKAKVATLAPLPCRLIGQRHANHRTAMRIERIMKSKLTRIGLLIAACLLANAICATGVVAQEKCVWRGTAPFCAGKCLAGERGIERGQSQYAADGGADCVTGSKVLCCSGQAAQAAPCPSGLVWRERFDGDTVCVQPAERDANRRSRGL